MTPSGGQLDEDAAARGELGLLGGQHAGVAQHVDVRAADRGPVRARLDRLDRRLAVDDDQPRPSRSGHARDLADRRRRQVGQLDARQSDDVPVALAEPAVGGQLPHDRLDVAGPGMVGDADRAVAADGRASDQLDRGELAVAEEGVERISHPAPGR